MLSRVGFYMMRRDSENRFMVVGSSMGIWDSHKGGNVSSVGS